MVTPNPNITHFLNVKLDKRNYLLWRFQFLPLLKLHDLEGFIDETSSCSVRFLPSTEKNVQPTINLKYNCWIKLNQMLLCWFIFSLTEAVLAYVVCLTASRDVWCYLKQIFESPSRIRMQQLKYQLHTVKMGSSSYVKIHPVCQVHRGQPSGIG